MEFNCYQYIPSPRLNISAVKIYQGVYLYPKGKNIGTKFYCFHKYYAIISSSKYEIKVLGGGTQFFTRNCTSLGIVCNRKAHKGVSFDECQ